MSSAVNPPMSPSSANARRIFDMIKTPITLLILLGILAFGAWYGYKQVTMPAPTEPPVPCQTVNAKVLKTSQVTVGVQNGGTKRGLAREVSNGLRAKGFQLLPSKNSDERVGQTVVIGAKADSPEVKLVAGFFKNPKIVPDGRVDGTVTVMVGNEFAGLVPGAPQQIALPGGEACVPAVTPTPVATG